jgi:hypothetical protein
MPAVRYERVVGEHQPQRPQGTDDRAREHQWLASKAVREPCGGIGHQQRQQHDDGKKVCRCGIREVSGVAAVSRIEDVLEKEVGERLQSDDAHEDEQPRAHEPQEVAVAAGAHLERTECDLSEIEL